MSPGPIPVPRTWRVSASVGFVDGSVATLGPDEVYAANIGDVLTDERAEGIGEGLERLLGDRPDDSVTLLTITVEEVT